MDPDLKGKTALVTGGSRGIGRAIALALAAEGVRVALCARDPRALGEAAGEIRREAGHETVTIAADLSRLDEVTRVVDESLRRMGSIDVLVNNAGAIRGGDFIKTPDEQWITDWNLKLLGTAAGASATWSARPRATRRPRTWPAAPRTPR